MYHELLISHNRWMNRICLCGFVVVKTRILYEYVVLSHRGTKTVVRLSYLRNGNILLVRRHPYTESTT